MAPFNGNSLENGSVCQTIRKASPPNYFSTFYGFKMASFLYIETEIVPLGELSYWKNSSLWGSKILGRCDTIITVTLYKEKKF